MKELPDEFSVDEATDRLVLLHKIDKGKKERKKANGLTTRQVDELMSYSVPERLMF